MTKAIPAKIKRYPGLVKAWQARYGSGGLGLYDPPSKRPKQRQRRGNTPNRSTRLGSRTRRTTKRRTADPKRPRRRSMSRGYRSIRGKPYRVGSRGGAYWSAGRKPRYDPSRPTRRSRVKGFLDKTLNRAEKWTDKYGEVSGVLTGLLAPLAVIIKRFTREGGTGFYQYPGDNSIGAFFTKGIPMEIAQLLSQPLPGTPAHPEEALKTLAYIQWKFTNDQSGWKMPFWASLATYLGCKFGIFSMLLSLVTNKANRIIKPIQKIAGGALVATTIGGLILPGTKLANETHSTSAPSLPGGTRTYIYGKGR